MRRTGALAMMSMACVLVALATGHRASEDLPPVVAPDPVPSDAIVLFDGTSLEHWQHADGSPASWIVEDGAMTVKPGSGSIHTVPVLQSAQLHIEFATPAEVQGEGQGRGNSGVYLQRRYEVQVLDSYENQTYADGQCGAIYKQYPPLVNASRGPGEWQTYDIIFTAAEFDDAGSKTSPARVTVIHNGVLIQHDRPLKGVTGASRFGESSEPGPILLQDHGNPVRYRNIWYRPLETE